MMIWRSSMAIQQEGGSFARRAAMWLSAYPLRR